MPRKSHPFWQFSLQVYGRTGVEPVCLALQQAGADVNLLLFCCWQGSQGLSLKTAALQKAMESVAAWQQQVVQPLRRARRASKLGCSGAPAEQSLLLSKHVAQLELDAEYLEQTVLAQHAMKTPCGKRTANPEIIVTGNLRRYLELLSIPYSAAIKPQVRILAQAIL